MSKLDILGKAVATAYNNGWRTPTMDFYDNDTEAIMNYYTTVEPVFDLIYDHDFAKALWGDGENYTSGKLGYMPKWKWHLANMVVAEDPIAYLGANI